MCSKIINIDAGIPGDPDVNADWIKRAEWVRVARERGVPVILDVQGKPIDPIWAAEFRGFFFGEGYIGITTAGRVNGPQAAEYDRQSYVAYQPRIQITQRDDALDVMEDIHKRLGGDLQRTPLGRAVNAGDGKEYRTKPLVIWRTRRADEISRILDILEGGFMPSTKRRQMIILRSYLRTMSSGFSGPKTPEKNAEFGRVLELRKALHAEMIAAHQYRPRGV